MNSKKKSVLLICPGRGSYTHETLHYFKKFEKMPAHTRIADFVERMNQKRRDLSLSTISEMDAESRFTPEIHGRGEHISSLIFTCSYADFLAINRDEMEIVAVIGNSMGWYTALAVAGSLSEDAAFDVVQTMGSMMKDEIIGGQVIYPIVDDDWQTDAAKERLIQDVIFEINCTIKSQTMLQFHAGDANGGPPPRAVYEHGGGDSRQDPHETEGMQAQAFSSIRLGGYIVLAGNTLGLSLLSQKLPKIEHFPARLKGHGAYHTPLLAAHSQKALQITSPHLFSAPQIPLIDGRGKIWSPRTTRAEALYQYTFETQVIETFDFTKAVTASLKEFAPQKIVILGPGNSLGAPVGQILVANKWQGMANKADFKKRQQENPFLVS